MFKFSANCSLTDVFFIYFIRAVMQQKCFFSNLFCTIPSSELQFKHVPLYLEWAPLDVFASGTQPSNETGPSAAEESKHDPEEEIAEESGV